jgi:Bacterial SCP ortholog
MGWQAGCRLSSPMLVPRARPARPRLTVASATFEAVSPRGFDVDRAVAALDEQRSALGEPSWPGPFTPAALGQATVLAVTAALAANQEPVRPALRAAVRYTLDRLAELVPGRSVEVRIPPFAAVQCVPGPRHTRGTPPNVVETDALTWLALATGTLDWATAMASGRVRASGLRADISAYLPVAEGHSAPGGH